MSTDFSNIEREIRMGMNLIERDEFSASIRAISHIAAQTVCKTLGPFARTIIIDDGNFTYPTKDGWSILKRLRFQDPTHQSIFNMLNNISFRIVDKVGDGTTTAMVVADHFIELMDEASKTIRTHRQRDVVNALNWVREEVISRLSTRTYRVQKDYDLIYNVAYVSSNGDENLARMIQEIYTKTDNPHILVDTDGGQTTNSEIQSGYRLDVSFLMAERYFNTAEKTYYSGQKHAIVVFDHNVTYQKHAELIEFISAQANRMGMGLIVMAPYFDDVMSAVFVTNIQKMLQEHPQSIPGLFVIQIPELVKASQRNAFQDFAALANVSIVNSNLVRLFHSLRHNENATDEGDIVTDPLAKVEQYSRFGTAQEVLDAMVGTVQDITIAKKYFTLHSLDKESVRYKEMYTKAKEAYDEAMAASKNQTTTLTKEVLDATSRLRRLSGEIGVIHVGGLTDLERQCARDVVDDATLACRSAFENGVVAGMNLAIMCAILETRDTYPEDNIGWITANILLNAYKATTADIFANKLGGHDIQYSAQDGFNYPVGEFIDGLIEHAMGNPRYSFDLVRGFGDDGKNNIRICNSAAADVEILNGIVSILSTVLTSDQYMSINRAYDKTAATRQQEAINERATSQQVTTVMTALEKFLKESDYLPKLLKSILKPTGSVTVLDSAIGDTTDAANAGDPDYERPFG